jgi:hypothetical protein
MVFASCSCIRFLSYNMYCQPCFRYILEARELPILSMFDRMKDQFMTRHYTKMKDAAKFTGPICPKIQKMLDKHIELSNDCFVEGAGDGLFKVAARFSSTPTDYIVDLKGNTCTCMRWAQSGIPCPHAVSCMRHDNKDPLKYVDHCYSVEAYKLAYRNIVYPCKDRTEWQKTGGPVILPPNYVAHVGRPTKNRRRAPGEIDYRGGGRKMSRHGVIMHCSYCSEPGHNRGGCKYLKQGIVPPNQANSAPPTSTQAEPVVTQDHLHSQESSAQSSVRREHVAVHAMAQQVILLACL